VLLSGLLGLLLLAITAASAYGYYRLSVAPHRYAVADIQVEQTPERIARGERWAYFCADCHSSSGGPVLDGSKDDFMADPSAPPIGSLWGPNLTPAGDLKNWSDGEILRAIREGVGKDGRPLVIMPSNAYKYMSDEDAYAIIAYLRSQPAVGEAKPKRNFNVLGALFTGAGMLPVNAQAPIQETIAVPASGTLEHGEYVANTMGCEDCHGPNLDGKHNGPTIMPAGPNLRAAIPNWTEEEFVKFFRSGELPNKRMVDTLVMPWKTYSATLTDEELKDMYLYLRNPARVEK
jgi:mono/diheme cytochrome c family protein